MKLKKSRVDELKSEIAELQMLKLDVQNTDIKNLHLSEYNK